MKVLIVGSGAREHAIAWKLRQSPRVTELVMAPGNAGTASIARNLALLATDIDGIIRAAQAERVGLVVVGPEAPLASGLVDRLQAAGIAAFGPTQAAAQLEASKVFAKELMLRHGIPCAQSRSFSSLDNALDYVNNHPLPLVIKADGLAAGKGVSICHSHQEARSALTLAMKEKVFGQAGERVIVEEYLEGREVSLLAFTDGQTVVPMVPACDYKRIFDDDEGPNTGGMGGYSPPSFFGTQLAAQVTETILKPTVRALAQEGIPYLGVLYAGLILTEQGPKVLEFNCRFGDPETQVILPRLRSDLLDILLAVVEGRLDQTTVDWDDGACVGVVLASGGYPGSYQTGFPITGWDCLDDDVLVFHAGTRSLPTGEVISDGGRVLTIVARGGDLAEARARTYLNVPCLRFQGVHFRTDIAQREISAESIP